MSYPPAPPPSDPHFYGRPAPPPPHVVHATVAGDGSKKFLNMSMGVLVAVITGILLVCCVGPIAVCFIGGFAGSILEASKPEPTAAITSCEIVNDGILNKATVKYTIRNNGTVEDNYLVTFKFTNDSGQKVDDGTDWVFGLKGGETAAAEADMFLDSAGATKCAVESVE